MPLEIDTVIPEDRKLTLELPPDFPVGSQRLTIRLIKLTTDSLECGPQPIIVDQGETKTA